MIKSMTGFAMVRRSIVPFGKITLEIRSVNHRFLDILLHLPEGFLQWELGLKDEIAKRIKRGHIICRLEINPRELKKPVLNNQLIKEYYSSLKAVSRQLRLTQEVNINVLMGLPGIWSMESQHPLCLRWSELLPLIREALDRIIQRRQQEGLAIYRDLKIRIRGLDRILTVIKVRYRKVVEQRLKLYDLDAEKNSFLKSSDINEEVVRLSFHLANFVRCLKSKKAIGKELDFVLQEMQRETNTIGAKSIDAFISGRIVRVKSEIEKMREQVQNVE